MIENEKQSGANILEKLNRMHKNNQCKINLSEKYSVWFNFEINFDRLNRPRLIKMQLKKSSKK